MEKFKFILFSIVILALVGIGGYWSVATLQSGPEYATEQKLRALQKENEDLGLEVKKLTADLSAAHSKLEVSAPSVEKTAEVPKTTAYKYQSLMNELQKLADGNVFLKLKSSGAGVGTVQKFLNIYNDTSNKIDNDYGVGTVNAIKIFQKDQGLTADGEAGPGTFSKMISWLKKQA
ncbi:MAG: peptidoglycan-binding domain-containing protein [Patescibacteria group bacterium]